MISSNLLRWSLAAAGALALVGSTTLAVTHFAHRDTSMVASKATTCADDPVRTAAENVFGTSKDEIHNALKLASNVSDPEKLEFEDAFTKNGSRVAVCFAPGTPRRTIEDFMRKMESAENGAWPDPLKQPRYFVSSSWPGTVGVPYVLKWSFAPDGLSIPGGVGEATAPNILFSRMDSLFSSVGGRATWITTFTQIFNRWTQLAGLSYSRIQVGGNDWDDGAAWNTASGAAGLRGDVRIAMHNIDGVNGILAYCFFPGSGNGGNMVIDSSEAWNNSGNGYRFLRNTLGHEHGHGIGIQHVCPANGTKLMEPFLNTSFDGPRQDDMRAAQRLYGDPFEPNNNTGQATNLGTILAGGTIGIGTPPAPVSGTSDANSSILSIETASASDYFKVTVNDPKVLSVTVSPVGSSYQDAPQDSACSTGPVTNALAIGNLDFQVFDTNGTTVIANGTGAPAGSAETLSNIALPAGGTYFIRVFATNSPAQVQMYKLNLTASNPVPAIISLSPDNKPAGSPAFTLTVNGTNFLTNSVVRWNGSDRPTTFVSATQLSATISSSDIASPGTAIVTVFNPTPGGGTSPGATFTITSSTVNVPPTSVTTLAGFAPTGGVSEVTNSDNLYYSSIMSSVGSRTSPVNEVEFAATAPAGTVTAFSFRVEASTTLSPLTATTQKVLFFNYTTGVWDVVDSRQGNSSDTVVDVSAPGNLNDYIAPGTREIKARFQMFVTTTQTTPTKNIKIDQAIWRLTY